MSYQELRIVKYNNQDLFEQEYNKRKTDYSTIMTNLVIHPFGKMTRITNKSYNLFVVNNRELIILQEQIMENAIRINSMLSNLPTVANDSFVRKVLIDEISSTNEIEGVHSSRKEIQQAIDGMKSNREKSRFSGIVKLYYYLTNKSFSRISHFTEIRKIYDELVSEEVAESDKLDGFYFRKDSVEVKAGEKTIHRGNPNEDSIIHDLTNLIEFMNDKNIPYLIRVILSHYFFEYIHPFYDGNGRTGRYIACKYLADRLDPLTALSFSHMINDKKDKYYKAFKVTSHENNMGEGTMFVYELLKIVKDGQEKLIENLENSAILLTKSGEWMERLSITDDVTGKILFFICQATLFNGFLLDGEISEMLNVHRGTIDHRIRKLVEKGLIKQVKKKPSQHELTDNVILEINNIQL